MIRKPEIRGKRTEDRGQRAEGRMPDEWMSGFVMDD